MSGQTIYDWREQDLIDTGLKHGVTSCDNAELESELAVTRRAGELLKQAAPPKRRFEAIAVMASEGLPVQTACRVMEVSELG